MHTLLMISLPYLFYSYLTEFRRPFCPSLYLGLDYQPNFKKVKTYILRTIVNKNAINKEQINGLKLIAFEEN